MAGGGGVEGGGVYPHSAPHVHTLLQLFHTDLFSSS